MKITIGFIKGEQNKKSKTLTQGAFSLISPLKSGILEQEQKGVRQAKSRAKNALFSKLLLKSFDTSVSW